MSIDERIRSAGSRLATTSVAVPDLERLVRRRPQRVRATAVAGSLAAISIAVAVLITYDGPREQSATEPATTADSIAEGATAPRFELTLEGATPLPVQSLTATSTDTTVWFYEAEQIYLTLVVRPGLALGIPTPTGLGYMVEDPSFPRLGDGPGSPAPTAPSSGS